MIEDPVQTLQILGVLEHALVVVEEIAVVARHGEGVEVILAVDLYRGGVGRGRTGRYAISSAWIQRSVPGSRFASKSQQ